MALVGCRSMHEPASQPAIPSTTVSDAVTEKSATFTSSVAAFEVPIPRAWKVIAKGGDYVLALTPEASSGDDGDPILAVQYPKLPPHIPGMLPLGGVAGGYVDDLRKRFPDEKVDSREEAALDGANSRRIVSSFEEEGKPFREIAMLAVHGDHVYVITATCPADLFGTSEEGFNQLTSQWKWTS